MRQFRPVRIGLCLVALAAAAPSPGQTRWQHFLSGGESYCVAAHGAEVWVGTTAGIRIYETSGPALRHRELSVRDKLPGNLVTALAFEPNAVWVGTAVGVVGRLDLERREWLYYDEQARFPRAEVSALVSAGQDMWAATRGGGLARFNPLRQDWEVWDHNEGLPSDQVNCLVADPQGLWAGTDRGLVRYLSATRQWQPVSTPAGRLEGRISALSVAGQYLWVASVGDGLTRIDLGSGDFLTYDLSRYGCRSVECVTTTPGGQVWIGVDNGLLSAQQNGQGSWELLARAWSPRGLAVVAGSVWVGTAVQGVWRYQTGAGTWEQYRAADPLPSGHLTAVAAQANLGWFGFRDDGLARYDTSTGNWTQLLPPGGAPRQVRAVAAHGNQVYCACADGIAIYDQRAQTWRTYLAKFERDLLRDDWTSVRVVGDSVWFAGPGRLCLFSTGEPEFLQTIELSDPGEGLAEDLPRLLTDDASGDVWCLTPGLAYRYQPRHNVWSWLDSEQLIPRDPNRYRSVGRLVRDAVCDNDSVWFVLVDRLAQYRKQLNDVVLWDEGWHAGLAEPRQVGVDRFSAWVACGPGLAQYERQSQQWHFAAWPAELQGEATTALAVDAYEPFIWVATSRRVARAELAEDGLSWTVFPPSTGIVSGVNRIVPARDGVWLVGRGGVTWYRRDLPATALP